VFVLVVFFCSFSLLLFGLFVFVLFVFMLFLFVLLLVVLLEFVLFILDNLVSLFNFVIYLFVYYRPVFTKYYLCADAIAVGVYFVNCFGCLVFKFYVILSFKFVAGYF
jgi:hypothetical protein